MRWVLVVMFLFFAFAGHAQENLKCSDQIKTGQFYTISGSDTCFIRRTNDRQYERCGSDTTEAIYIVVWLKPKKYILRDINYNPSTAQRVMNQDAVMTILEVEEDYYKVHFKRKGQRKKFFKIYCA